MLSPWRWIGRHRRLPGPCALLVLVLVLAVPASAAPLAELQLPGSQPIETKPAAQPELLRIMTHDDDAATCSDCHVVPGFDEPTPSELAASITHTWSGGMMAQASRDPVTWAQIAIAEQDFPGAGDFCLRCHVPVGWVSGRSAASDGSQLLDTDADGVTCHLCHRLANPDDSGILGEQAAPYVAQRTPPATEGSAVEGFYGSGMYVLYQGAARFTSWIDRLGPYSDADAPHNTKQSLFIRDAASCGVCHDVSNPVVGDLAPGNGALPGAELAPGEYSGDPADQDVSNKAAFNVPPYAYGIEQRTFSEHQASAFATLPVSSFASLPSELKVAGGSIELAYQAALIAGEGGDYADGTERTFSCQTCHMRPTFAEGCNFDPGPRGDMPVHDLTGANYWAGGAIQYLDAGGRLHIGGGLSQDQNDAIDDAALRAIETLESSASLAMADGDPSNLAGTLRVTNLTGHKLPTGYPDGRRVWLNIRWYDAEDQMLREDGAYGAIDLSPPILIGGELVSQVDSLLDLADVNTRIYQSVLGIGQPWAAKLIADEKSGGLAADPNKVLGFDRHSGAADLTLGELAAMPSDAVVETFHLVLNDQMVSDNRIPPYGMDFAVAQTRNATPIPDTLYLGGEEATAGSQYLHYDELDLNPPDGATRAQVALMYQPMTWEYMQFLSLANQQPEGAELETVGEDVLEAWFETGMAAPVEIAAIALPEPGSGAGSLVVLGCLALLARRRTLSRSRGA